MIDLKTDEEIGFMQEGGEILRKTVIELKKFIREGISTLEIDAQAERFIKEFGGQPSFSRVKGYHWTTCVPINEEIVHTPPSKRVLKNGDVLTVDIGVYYKKYNTDFADTFVIGGTKDEKIRKFLQVGKDALYKAIRKFKKGNYIGDVSKAIEDEIYSHGYFVIKQLTGHGLGRSLHEDPYIPAYLDKPINQTQIINQGLTAAIEVIYSMGTEDMVYDEKDSWSIKTKDNSLSACFEHSLAIAKKDTVILT